MSSLSYRPSIDGLRTIAVAAVMAFHLSASILPGGYLGVDVFFVISGYLITLLLILEVEGGSFSLLNFYQRRIARIFPLLLAVIAVTVLASLLFYAAEDIASTGASALAAAVSAANFKFMLQGDYFAMLADTTPLLHTWTLSVEEQFYLAMPLIVWLTVTRASRRAFVVLLAVAGVASLALCVWLTHVNRIWAFYSMPTRAWELMAGSLVAALSRECAPCGELRAARITATIALAGIVISTALMPETQDFPGWRPAVPVLATAAFLFSERAAGEALVARFLRHPIMVGVGKRSYSLYMWHWPIYAFVDYRLLLQPTWLRTALKLGLTFATSFLTYRLLERPARAFLARPQARMAAFGLLVAGAASVSGVGLLLWRTQYLESNVARSRTGGIEINEGSGRPQIALYGDSVASMYGKVLADDAKARGFALNVLSVAGERPFPPSPLWTNSLKWLQAHRPTCVVLAANWVGAAKDAAAVRTVVRTLSAVADRLVILGQPPFPPPEANRQAIRDRGLTVFRESSRNRRRRENARRYLLSIAPGNAEVIDLDRPLVTPTGALRVLDDRGRPLYQDYLHLSYFGATAVLASLQAPPCMSKSRSAKPISTAGDRP
jgi:peptidoglycan/LPS O-acetylase OafA/YrhL